MRGQNFDDLLIVLHWGTKQALSVSRSQRKQNHLILSNPIQKIDIEGQLSLFLIVSFSQISIIQGEAREIKIQFYKRRTCTMKAHAYHFTIAFCVNYIDHHLRLAELNFPWLQQQVKIFFHKNAHQRRFCICKEFYILSLDQTYFYTDFILSSVSEIFILLSYPENKTWMFTKFS